MFKFGGPLTQAQQNGVICNWIMLYEDYDDELF